MNLDSLLLRKRGNQVSILCGHGPSRDLRASVVIFCYPGGVRYSTAEL